MTAADPHAAGGVLRAGAAPGAARLGLVLLHGRGASAQDILRLGAVTGREDIALVAPEAAGNSWWPASFLAPMAQLQPWLDSALAAVGRAVAGLESEGLARRQIALAGVSQGACLALEWAARHGPLHSVTALSGGLLGTADAPGGPEAGLYGHAPKRFDQDAPLAGMPVDLSCHQSDPHIPLARVRQSAEVLSRLGADVDLRLHPGVGHEVTEADLAAFRSRMG